MISSFQPLSLSVPDVAAGRDFYRDFGMQPVDRGDSVAMRCVGRDQDQVVLFEGPRREVHHRTYGVLPGTLADTRRGLERAGVELLDAPVQHGGEGVWLRDPHGYVVHLTERADAGSAGDARIAWNTPGHFERLGDRGCPTPQLPTRPRRLGHIIVFSPDPDALARFYIEHLGMRLSDRVGDGFAVFLRTQGDSDHHVLGLLRNPQRGLHHASFEVGSLDEMQLGMLRMQDAGHRHAWGLGRHVVGSNYFQYFRDPYGSMAEYFVDIDHIPADQDWEARDWGKDGMFLWSVDGPPPEDFAHNYYADEG